jgi:predicted dehydrogenase
MNSILLVGAGQMGLRYLQGLVNFNGQLKITIVDQSDAILLAVKELLSQMKPPAGHEVYFAGKLEVAPQDFDLAIVATPAHCRSQVVVEIASRHQVKAWILEKVLAQSVKQLDQIEQALAGHAQVWVNTPRRLMGWHQAIRAQLLPDGPAPLQVRVEGGSWGLACNAIHFIDLVAWWTQAHVNSVSTDGLNGWDESKRVGFQEVFGSLLVGCNDGSVLNLCCLPDSQPAVITLETLQGSWRLEEAAGVAAGPSGQQLKGQLSFQSDLTAPLVAQILEQGHCALPTLAESAAQHRPLLQALLAHWNRSQGRHDLSVPIT